MRRVSPITSPVAARRFRLSSVFRSPVLEGSGDTEDGDSLASEVVMDLDRFGEGGEEAAGTVDLEDFDENDVAAFLVEVRGGALNPVGNSEVWGGPPRGYRHGGVRLSRGAVPRARIGQGSRAM